LAGEEQYRAEKMKKYSRGLDNCGHIEGLRPSRGYRLSGNVS
jgi:hypothetical protein